MTHKHESKSRCNHWCLTARPSPTQGTFAGMSAPLARHAWFGDRIVAGKSNRNFHNMSIGRNWTASLASNMNLKPVAASDTVSTPLSRINVPSGQRQGNSKSSMAVSSTLCPPWQHSINGRSNIVQSINVHTGSTSERGKLNGGGH